MEDMKCSPKLDMQQTIMGAAKEEYPSGLKLHLGIEELKKLGFDTLPQVGEKIRFEAESYVEMVSEDHVCLQIKGMELEEDVEEQDASEVLYT